eukprot:CAMPEP_0197519536 /NCGR_PEP_ID=MMETSP1318-20131121/4804_1 /TAXON_ID=552666 /ORGANISM="Partenskyella glossopodia, Strain RCC365" /LENGTH=366 /DNA_ID=CAMNT_0043070565 /DNA_START=58 /DNA_END=1158 /DNA_ORIENTATION=-
MESDSKQSFTSPNRSLSILRENIASLVLPLHKKIPRVSAHEMSALSFHRDYVSRNTPVIITDAIGSWPAMKLWDQDLDYLTQKLGKQEVTVDFTPDGRGDSLTEDGKVFVEPSKHKLPFQTFAQLLKSRKKGLVTYLQHQNSNFSTEFKGLKNDIQPIRFAAESFGDIEPDAVNIWIGDDRSVSSLHRDPYENMYAVIQGQKTFTLLPPTDGPYLSEQAFPAARYHLDKIQVSKLGEDYNASTCIDFSKEFKIRQDDDKSQVHWIPVDPDYPNRINRHAPCLKHAKAHLISPIRCVVNRGEVLYLPSSWFHQVSQTQLTIAVNYWYDMHYGLTWSLLQYLEDSVRDRAGIDDDAGDDDEKKGDKIR